MKLLKIVVVVLIAAVLFAACNKNKWNPVNPQPTDTPDVIVPTGTRTITPTITLTSTNTPPWTPTVTSTVTQTLTKTLTPTRTFTMTFTLTPTPTPTFYWVASSNYIVTGCDTCPLSMAVDGNSNAFVSVNTSNGVKLYRNDAFSGLWSELSAGLDTVTGPYSMAYNQGRVTLSGITHDSKTTCTYCGASCAEDYYCYTEPALRPAVWSCNQSTYNSWQKATCGSGSNNDPCYTVADSNPIVPVAAASGSGAGVYSYINMGSYFSISKADGNMSFSCVNKGDQIAAYYPYGSSIYAVKLVDGKLMVYNFNQSCGAGGLNAIGSYVSTAAGLTGAGIYVADSGGIVVAHTTGTGVYVHFWNGSEWQEVVNGEIGVSADCLYLKGDGTNAYLSYRDKSNLNGVFVYKINMSAGVMSKMKDGALDYVVSTAAASSFTVTNGTPYVAYVGFVSKQLKIKRAAY